MLNVAIIGTGGIAPLHIKGYLTFKEDVNIVALCDIYPEKAEKMAADFDLDVTIYDDHEELLANESIDLVSVCTPPYVHAEIAINAMKAGAHAVVEKPMAASLKECDDMNRVSEETGKTLSIISAYASIGEEGLRITSLSWFILHNEISSFHRLS